MARTLTQKEGTDFKDLGKQIENANNQLENLASEVHSVVGFN